MFTKIKYILKCNSLKWNFKISQLYTICRYGHSARNLRSVDSPISLQGFHSYSGNSTWGCVSRWGWLCSVLWLQSSWLCLCCCSTCGPLLWWCWPWQQWLYSCWELWECLGSSSVQYLQCFSLWLWALVFISQSTSAW